MIFQFYWRGGRHFSAEGDSVENAFRDAGYGGGAIRALDFYEQKDEPQYVCGVLRKRIG